MEDVLTRFPRCVKCVSSDTVVFVSCPSVCRMGDIRKTLATLLHIPFSMIHIAPVPELVFKETEPSRPQPFANTDMVPSEEIEGKAKRSFFTVAILKRGENGEWVER